MTHADGPTRGFGGAPNWATKRCAGRVTLPKCASGAHADGPAGGFGGASSLWGHGALYWVGENAKVGFCDARGRSHWGFRCSSLWGHEALYW
eukprot:896377-Pyramimonas_sp.AAC.1